MATRHQRVPNLLTRSTYEDQEKGVNDVKKGQAPNTGVNRKEQREGSFSRRCKDSEVLEEDGEFYKGHGNSVGDCREVDPLYVLSVLGLRCLITGIEHT